MSSPKDKALEIQDTLRRVGDLEQTFSDLLTLAYSSPVGELKGAWEVLGDRGHSLETATQAEEVVHQKLTQCASRCRPVAWKAWGAMNGRLAASGDPSLLATADFRGAIRFHTPADSPSQQPWVVGPLRALAEGHPVRKALALGEAFQADGEGWAVLGKARELRQALVAADWYDLQGAIDVTRRWRASQVQREEKAREEEAQRKAEEEARREDARAKLNTAYLLSEVERLTARVAELEGKKVA